MRGLYSRKEQYPTKVWNVNVSHATQIYNVHGHSRDAYPHQDYSMWTGGDTTSGFILLLGPKLNVLPLLMKKGGEAGVSPYAKMHSQPFS